MAPRHDRHGQVIAQEYAAEVPVSDLVEHPDNPRRGDTGLIADSIAHNGFYGAVIAQRATNRVLAGNHRLRAAVSEGLETLPVIWVDVDDESATRILLADNRTSDLAGFDNSDLAELLEQLTGSDAHLAGTGYTQADLDMLLEDLAGDDPPDNLGDTDEIPDPPPPKTVPGDIWLLGPHRVMCGNSTSPTDVAALLDGTLADAVWTDPPYGVSYVGKTADALTISNDGADEFETVLDGAFDSILTAAKPGAPVYVAAPAGPQSVSFAQRLLDRNLFRQRLIWVKNTLVLGHSDYHYRHEDIYFGYTPAPKGSGVLGRGGVSWLGDNAQTSTLFYDKPSRSEEHPTTKPVDLIVHCLRNHRGKTVLDLFGGSGSTLVAAHMLRREAFLMELDPRFVDVICRRYQRLTGDLPVSAATGRPHDFDSD